MFKIWKNLFYLIILTNLKSFSQFSTFTYVPDNNFEMYLEANGMGNGILNDDSVSTFLISSVDELTLNFLNISDLTGIENFISLEELECNNNSLTNLDLSNNNLLEELKCSDNQITNLTLNNLFSLEEVNCSNNQITNLDITMLNNLEELDCSNNQIANLNFSGCSSIEKIYCNNNSLLCLNLKNGNNSNISDIIAVGNMNLNCIEVDNPSFATFNWSISNGFYFDNSVTFSLSCPDSCSSVTSDSTLVCDSIVIVYDTLTVYDTLVYYNDTVTLYDSVSVCDSIIIIYDTLLYSDTITYYDTITFNDTNYISIGVTDTLYMNVVFTNSLASNYTIIKIFPNPANDFLNIHNGDYSNITDYELKISNGLGQSVFSSLINIPQFQIPISVIGSSGLYYIQVFDNNGNLIVTKQLIIN